MGIHWSWQASLTGRAAIKWRASSPLTLVNARGPSEVRQTTLDPRAVTKMGGDDFAQSANAILGASIVHGMEGAHFLIA